MVPPAAQGRPVVEIDVQVQWIVEHPGCARMSTAPSLPPQVFQLTGPRADEARHEAERGQRAPVQRLRVTGYVTADAELTTVCGTARPFVLIEMREPTLS
jgi:hypothetical protein